MTTEPFLLDTNAAIIALLKGDPVITQFINTLSQVFISLIALGELYLGAERSERREDNLKRVDELSKQYAVLLTDMETAKLYGRVLAQLRRKGQPIPQNDVWIAAVALQFNLTLLTRDAHFQNVDNLRIQSW